MKAGTNFLILACILFGLLTGCKAKQPAVQTIGPSSAQTVLDAAASSSDPSYAGPDISNLDPLQTEPNPQTDPSVKDGAVDVDLTALSSTMVYAEVYNMMTNPDAYMGKTLKVRGTYYSTYLEDTKNTYYFVVISDATACCQQGIEFIWNGEHSDLQDYPEEGSEIEVTGVFGSYQEQDQTYYCLAVDEMKRR